MPRFSCFWCELNGWRVDTWRKQLFFIKACRKCHFGLSSATSCTRQAWPSWSISAFFVGSAFESSHCSRVLHQRVDSRVDEQSIGLVNEEVTHSGLSVFLPCSKRSPSCSCSNATRQRAPTRQPSRPAANLLTSASSNSFSSWNVLGCRVMFWQSSALRRRSRGSSRSENSTPPFLSVRNCWRFRAYMLL